MREGLGKQSDLNKFLHEIDEMRDIFTIRWELEGDAQFCLSTGQGLELNDCTPALPPKVGHMGQLVSCKVLCWWTLAHLWGSCRHPGTCGGGLHHPATSLEHFVSKFCFP